MEDKKTIFDYIAQAFLTFGISIFMLNVFCLLVGDSAKDISTIFELGKKGLSVHTTFQFFLTSIFITCSRFLFLTDIIIKNMSVLVRTICMLLLDIGIMVIFVIYCKWFPIHMWQPWLLFLLCFGSSFIVAIIIMLVKEKMENRKMEEALKKLKEEEKDELRN